MRPVLLVLLAAAVFCAALQAQNPADPPARFVGVTALAVSADGKQVVVGYKDGRTVVFNAATGQALHTYEVFKDPADDPDPLANHPWRDAVASVAFANQRVRALSFSGWDLAWNNPPDS